MTNESYLMRVYGRGTTAWLMRRITPHRRANKPVGVEYWTVAWYATRYYFYRGW